MLLCPHQGAPRLPSFVASAASARHAGAGGARSRAISDRISWNIVDIELDLGRRIRAFWADAGAGGPRESPVWGVRSDLIGGLPAVMTKPGGSPTSSAWACRLDRAA